MGCLAQGWARRRATFSDGKPGRRCFREVRAKPDGVLAVVWLPVTPGWAGQILIRKFRTHFQGWRACRGRIAGTDGY